MLIAPTRAGAAGTAGSTPRPLTAAGAARADPNALAVPPSLDQSPPQHVLSARHALAIADAVPKVRAARRRHAPTTRQAFEKGTDRWQVSYYDARRHEIAQVTILDRNGRVLEAWDGFQVAWTMARGYEGAFGRKVDALYVWLPLCVLFVLPFIDPRRLWRLLHLDLLVLLGFSVSLAFFNQGQIGLSVPLAYPPLAYLLVRMLALAAKRHRAGAAGADPPPAETLHLLVPVSWLALAVIFLIGFRVGLNVTNSNVIDVGYAGVIGADKLARGQPLYGHFPHDNEHGDTYGPVNYLAYVPFERALGWGGRWDDLPAAHGAAIAFDLLALALLWLLGRRIRGPTLGTVLAYAWVTYPFTLFVSNSNANDSLVAVLVLLALLLAGRPFARGGAVALAGLTKFAPLALAPLLATYDSGTAGARPLRLRTLLPFALGFSVVGALVLLPAIEHGALRVFYERTIEFQSGRGSPFSLWGYYGGLGTLQTVVQVAGVGLALAVAIVPRRRDLVSLSALAAAVLIGLQLGVTHWFYLYIVWFFPLVLVALLARYRAPPGA